MNYGKFVSLSAVSLLTLSSAASAAMVGLVGQQVTLETWSVQSATVENRTFVVSNLLTEYYYSAQIGAGFGAIALDIKNNSMRFDADFIGSSFAFNPDAQFCLRLPESIMVDSFTVGSSSQVSMTAFDACDLSYTDHELIFRAGGVVFQAPGAYLTLNFSLSTVPGPSSLLAAACLFTASRTRRRAA